MLCVMTRAVLAGLVVLLAACQAGAGDDYPPRPGGGGPVIIGGGGGGGATGDAGVSDGGAGDAGVPVSGRVCVLSDMRQLTKCKDTGAGGLKVSLGTGIGTTNPDGTFSFVAPLGSHIWHVTGPLITTSVMPLEIDKTIPVMSAEDYVGLLESNRGLMQDEQHGSVVVRVVNGTSPVAGVTATLSPIADSETLYDADNNPTVWNTTSTGSGGVVWVPSVPLSSSVTITSRTTGGQTGSTSAPVERQSITFVTQSVP